MRKFTTTIVMVLAMALSLFAQVPQTMSYQAVVRNVENAIVASQSVSIELSILQGTDDGTAVYTETHNATTNANGLITLEMGAGESSDNFSAIDWSAGPYFVKTVAEIDGKQVTGVAPMLVVPYAKYAETAGNVPDMSEYAKKSDIPADVDLSNYATKSELPSLEGYAKTEDIPSLDGYAKTEDLPNMSEYTKTADLPTVDLSGYAKTSEIADMATKTYVDAAVAAVEVPTTVAELTDAADYAKTSDVSLAITTATTDMATKTYVDGKVAAVEVPTTVVELTDAADYAKTSDVSSAIATATTDMATKTYVDAAVAAVEVPTTVAELTDAADYANVQADWEETDATKDSYIKNKPTLATVATSGSYEDLSNKPTIPDVTGFATKTELEDYAKTEDLPDVSGFAVKDTLQYYYKKSDVDALLAELTAKIQQLDEQLNLPEGAIYGKFSVSADKQVYFSQGNLQYQASTNTWRFAENQYDIIGDNNSNISSTYSGWIDLFGWGTSGWNSGANAYQPYSTSTDYEDYYPGGSYSNNLTGSYANADWGVYNKISNGGNTAGQWRTLTYVEWNYLLSERTDASALKGSATVNGVTGMILLPDNWTTPSGITFTSGMNGFSNNTYTTSDWAKMEANGAVFLPAAGIRDGSDVLGVGSYGFYWSSSEYGDNAGYLDFYSDDAYMGNSHRSDGQSVRLVRGLN